MSYEKTEADSVAAIARASVQPLHFLERKGIVVLANGSIVKLEDENTLPNPTRKRARADLYDVASFISYVNSHKVAGQTHLFGEADEDSASVSAHIDYHSKASADYKEHGLANWNEHNATLTLRVTPEWSRWLTNNNRIIPQQEFAEFIEDNLGDIIEPAAGELLDVAQLLVGKKSVVFKSGKNLKNGAVQLEYSETIEAGRKDDAMQVPARLTLALSPFAGGAPSAISARLRFRIGNNGALSFQYILDRPFKVLEAAFKSSVEKIEKETGFKVHLGSAEVLPPSHA